MDTTVRVACVQAAPVAFDCTAERRRFDPAGHYHRRDVLTLNITPRT